MAYVDQITTTKKFIQNVVIQIGDHYFANRQPDSGLTIDSDKVGLIRRVQLSPTQIEVEKVSTSVATMSFELVDKDEAVSDYLGADQNDIYTKQVTVYVGRITGSFAWSDYVVATRVRVKSIKKVGSSYVFNCAESSERIQKRTFTTKTKLAAALAAGATSLILDDASDFPSAGTINADGEMIDYTGKSTNTLTGLTRAQLGSTDEDHEADSEVFLVSRIQGNPVDLILQILISGGGGGTYDVLTDGCGIDPTLIDVAGIEALAPEYEAYTFTTYLWDIENALRMIEERFLAALGFRLVAKSGKISLAVLDQATFNNSQVQFTRANSVSEPEFETDSNRIRNVLDFEWDWLPGSDKFQRFERYQNQSSIDKYGERDPLPLQVKASIANGDALFSATSTRLLTRLSQPRARVTWVTDMEKSLPDAGDDVRVTHEHLPKPGAGLGLDTSMEIMSKAINLESGDVRYTLEFASYSNLKMGFIAPAPMILAVGADPMHVSGCTFIFDPGRLDGSLNDGDLISSYTDPVQGLVFTGSGGNRLTLKKNIVNGKSVARGDSGKVLSRSVLASDLFVADQVTIYIVLNPGTAGVNRPLWGRFPGDTNRVFSEPNGGTYYWDYGNALGVGRVTGPLPSGWASAWHTIRLDLDPSTDLQRVLVDNAVIGSGTNGTGLSVAATNTLTIEPSGSGGAQADLAYLAIFNRKVTDAEDLAIRTWIQNRFYTTTVSFTQSSFPVTPGKGQFFQAGYKVRLWRGTGYLADPVNTIQSVNGDIITVATPWASGLDSLTRLKFADYDDASDDQKNLFAFICGNSAPVKARDGAGVLQLVKAKDSGGVLQQVVAFNPNPEFADGQPAYQVIP